NAYNAIVLRSVIDHYPIPTNTREYPAHSFRQVPGAFESATHRVAGRMVSLDQIEKTILPEFRDPRAYLALGRGSLGGGRLRSEAFSAERLDAQLADAAAECVARSQCVQIDRLTNKVVISPIFSWRESEFVSAYADKALKLFASRSPLERAVLGFV